MIYFPLLIRLRCHLSCLTIVHFLITGSLGFLVLRFALVFVFARLELAKQKAVWSEELRSEGVQSVEPTRRQHTILAVTDVGHITSQVAREESAECTCPHHTLSFIIRLIEDLSQSSDSSKAVVVYDVIDVRKIPSCTFKTCSRFR